MLNIETYDQFCEITGKQQVFCEEPMSKHTTFRIGGPAAVFAQPSSAEELAALLRLLAEKNIRPRV